MSLANGWVVGPVKRSEIGAGEANTMTSRDYVGDPSGGLLGSGLNTSVLALILGATILVFLFWGGPLWSAPTGASHVGRIVMSYVAAIPMVAMALRLQHRWNRVKFFSATALLWGAKVVLSTSVYPYLTPGSASLYAPARPWERQQNATAGYPRRSYAAAPALFGTGDLEGRVTSGGSPIGGAIVEVEDPPSGRALPGPRDLVLHIETARYDRAAYLAFTTDHLRVSNHDSVLHTLLISAYGRTVRNVPLPSKDLAQPLGALPPGRYQVACGNHAREHALLRVVDHPYATITDDRGEFMLPAVPPGRHSVALYTGLRELRRPIDVAPGARAHVVLDLGAPEKTVQGKAE